MVINTEVEFIRELIYLTDLYGIPLIYLGCHSFHASCNIFAKQITFCNVMLQGFRGAKMYILQRLASLLYGFPVVVVIIQIHTGTLVVTDTDALKIEIHVPLRARAWALFQYR